MKINEIGEYKLIERILKKSSTGKSRVIVGPGDDAAVFSCERKKIVVTKDIFVERVHFRKEWSSFFNIGYKSVVANVGDLAAMGGAKPLFILVGLATPVDTSVDNVDNLYRGITEASKKYGITLLGGDTVLSKKDIVISITLIGKIDKKMIIRRSGAGPGEKICCVGTFGDSAAGLKILNDGCHRSKWRKLVSSHLKPEVKLKEAAMISSSGKATAMLDSSDGLAACVGLICKHSKLGARVELSKIPLSAEFRRWAERQRKFPWEVVLNGGEEYNIVFTIRQGESEKLARRLGAKKIKINVLGVTTAKGKIEYLLNGKRTKFEFSGFQNF